MNVKKTSNIMLLLTGLVFNTALAQAGPDAGESLHASVQQGVHDYLLQRLAAQSGPETVHVTVNDIDNRIAIPACPSGFEYAADDQALAQSYVSVRVSCNNNEWYLFANAKVAHTQPVVVTSGMISPGTVLSADNLVVTQVETNRLRHTAYQNITDLVGARMKRRVRQGQPVQANMLCFVCEGDRITISAEVGSMQVKTSGIAKQDGVIGDNITVMNTSSQKNIIAEVASTEKVVVRL